MSEKINPREVLRYLNELGYYNVTARQLKEFIRDLKILMKYDHKKCMTDKENEDYRENKIDQKHDKPPKKLVRRPCREIDIEEFSRQINLNTREDCNQTSETSTRAKDVSKKGETISVEIRSRPKYSVSTISCPDSEMRSSSETTTNKTGKYPSKEIITSRRSNINRTTSAPSHFSDKKSDIYTLSEYDSRSAKSQSQRTHKTVRKSFIIPPKPVKIQKCDPVALYQKYQEEWKKHKLPGEDKHFDLRWAIRERMIGSDM